MNNKRIKAAIIIVSILVPLVVAFLYTNIKVVHIEGIDLSFLPGFNAFINSITFCLLIFAFVAIMKQKVVLHRFLMSSAIILSIIFLLSYVTFHSLYEATTFEGEGPIKFFYYFILITHIILSAVVLPLVLYAFYRAIIADYEGHKKIVKFAYPIWVYVAFTGVVVYFMISPYYKFILK